MDPKPSKNARVLLFAGVVCIFGGEALCILGPMRYERTVHMVCHSILYAGIGSFLLGVFGHLRGRSRE